MTPILNAILVMTPFPMSDSGRLLVCYLTRQILPESVKKPFVSILLGFNLRLTRLLQLSSRLTIWVIGTSLTVQCDSFPIGYTSAVITQRNTYKVNTQPYHRTAQPTLHFAPRQIYSFIPKLDFSGKHSTPLQLLREDLWKSCLFPKKTLKTYLFKIAFPP